MTAGRFVGLVVAMLLAALVLVWVLVSIAALVYALTRGDGSAATTYAVFVVVGVAVAGLGAWAARRVAEAARERD